MEYFVLAADDEVELLDILELYLTKEGIRLIKAKDGAQALRLFSEHPVHAVLPDVMMPEVDGFGVLKKIRETSRVPAIMVTAKGEDYNKILGLSLGADDYITKPYNPLEVVARLKAQLRRGYEYVQSQSQERIQVGEIALFPQEGIVVKGDQTYSLTSKELGILHLLMRSPGRIFTKQQIFTQVWDDEYLGDDNTIMVHISNLRAKIEANPKDPVYIKTVKGLGYKFEKETPHEA